MGYQRYGKHWALHALADYLFTILVLLPEVVILLFFSRELELFFTKYENILWIFIIIAFILVFYINLFIHNTIEKITSKSDKKSENTSSKNETPYDS